MDKIENSEKLAESIVQYLKDHNVVHEEDKHWMECGPLVDKERLETYIREAILEFMRKEKQDFVENLNKMGK